MKLIEKIKEVDAEFWLDEVDGKFKLYSFNGMYSSSKWQRLHFFKIDSDLFYKYEGRPQLLNIPPEYVYFGHSYFDHRIKLTEDDSSYRINFFENKLKYVCERDDLCWIDVRGKKRIRKLCEERKIALENGWIDDFTKTLLKANKSTMPKDWLQCRVTIKEINKENNIGSQKFTDRIEELKSKMVEGDELWQFKSNDKSWASLAGCEGLVLIRDGEEIDCILAKVK